MSKPRESVRYEILFGTSVHASEDDMVLLGEGLNSLKLLICSMSRTIFSALF